MSGVSTALKNHPGFARMIFSLKPFRKLDFSTANTDLATLDLTNTPVFSRYVFHDLLSNNACIGIGGYRENRVIYQQRKHFGDDHNSPRCIHLGTDIWTDAGEPIYAPLSGVIHSFAFNNHYGDYGPAIILRHELDKTEFFTLYGHLSLESLDGLYEGKEINSGERLGEIGNYPINGDWPPHLHFQIINDIGNFKGDFPGVSSLTDLDYYLSICPDPNLILRISENELSKS